MFRNLRRCRIGLLLVAGALTANGLSARSTRGLRIEAPTHSAVQPPATVVLEPEEPSLDLQVAEAYALLKPLGAPAEIQENMRAIADSAVAGTIDDYAIWAASLSVSDPALQSKVEQILKDFATALVMGVPAVSADGVPTRFAGNSLQPSLSATGELAAQREADLQDRRKAASDAIDHLDADQAFDHAAVLARIDASAHDGLVNQAAIDEAADAIADSALAEKVAVVLSDYSSARADATLNPRSALRSPVELPGSSLPGSGLIPLSCGTCAAPGGTLPAPTAACQCQSGNTNSCGSPFREVYNVSLVAGTQYVFTMCTATCPGATANYDTRIIVWDPTCVTQLANNDDFCGLLSQATVTATVTGVHKVEVTGYTASNSGTYTMCYKALPASTCGTCAAPLTTLVPTAVCQTTAGSNTSCPNTSTATTPTGGKWYSINMTAGNRYDFSTCPNVAPSGCFGTATFDTRLDIWNSACVTRVATNDDAPGCSLAFRSSLAYQPTVSGTYKLQVRGFSTNQGTFTLGYRVNVAAPCGSPVVTAINPASGNTQLTCGRTETFVASLAFGAAAGTVTFTITPPAGGTATPSTGVVPYINGQTSVSFTSVLTRARCGNPQNFTVRAVAVAACAPTVTNTRSITYSLFDRTPPMFVGCPANITIDCAAPVPARANPTATDNCDLAPTITFSETTTTLSCPGNRNITRTWTARDCNGNIGTCRQTIAVRDTTPPRITSTDQRCLAPPNHEYKCYFPGDFHPTIVDDCSPPTGFIIVGCTSDEPDNGTGDGDFPNDCIVAPNGSEICIRSERAGSLNDRHYTVLGIAFDACGNRSRPGPIATVTVYHDDELHAECDSPDSGLDKRF